MIVLTTTTDQVVQVGQPIIFDNVELNTGCACHRRNSPFARIIRRGDHLISFNANIGSDTALTDATVTLRDSGENIPGTVMNSVTAAGGDINNVSVTIPVHVCCGLYGAITAVNTGTTPINVGAGASLSIVEL